MERAYTLQHGDSLELLAEVPDGSVDLLLTDPPYNLSPYSTGNIRLGWRKEINNDLASWDKSPFRPGEWVEPFRRVLNPSGNLFLFTSYNLLGEWHRLLDPLFDTFQFLVWHKINPVPKVRRAGFLNSCELVVCCWNRGHKWNFLGQKRMHNFIESPLCMGKERVKEPFHPTQKPLKVLCHLVEISTDPGDLVLDPFMGVGSTGVAALSLGRRFTGMELDQRYFDAAQRRIEGEERVAGRDVKGGER